MKKYIYYLRNRPPSIGTQPKDTIEIGWNEVLKNERIYHGTVTYGRKLTQKEVEDYELDYFE